MKTLFIILAIIGLVLGKNLNVHGQSSRVNKLKQDSIDLNKTVYAVIAAEKGSTERKYMIDNLKKRFPSFMKLLIQDAEPRHYIEVLDFANRNSKRQIELQELKDKLIAIALQQRRSYMNQGYNDTQADRLVLEKFLMRVCFETHAGKDVIPCITENYEQYIEDLELFTPDQVNSLVTQLKKSLEQEYYRSAKPPTKKVGSKN